MPFDLDLVREKFPSLSRTDDGQPRIYFDNPAGTQVPQSVADRMAECLIEANANLGGTFRTSRLADEVAQSAHDAMADFLNARSSDEIVFGQNMTTITLHLSRSVGRALEPGDEIVLSRMDHDANVHPWVLMARDHDLVVRWLPFDTETFEFDLSKLDELLNEKTRLVLTSLIVPVRLLAPPTQTSRVFSFNSSSSFERSNSKVSVSKGSQRTTRS